MKREIPQYIQNSFNQIVEGHVSSGAFDNYNFDEIKEHSLDRLVALEECESKEERDAIYDAIKSDRSLASGAIYNIVSATDHFLHAKDLSAYRARKKQVERPVYADMSFTSSVLVS